MANISPKLLQKAIHTSRKLALFTTSTAALLLSSSGALAETPVPKGVIVSKDGANFSDSAAVDSWKGINDDGTSTGISVDGPSNGDAMTFGGNFNVKADVPTTVQGINVNGTTPGTLTITQDTTFGSTVTNAGGAQVSLVIDGVIGTLSGTSTNATDHGFDAATNTYTGLGSIIIKGVNGTLIIQSADSGLITILGTIDGSLDSTGNPQGTVEVNTPTIFKAAIGGTTLVDAVVFNNGATVSQAGNISVKTIVRIAQDAGNNASVVSAGAINGPVFFQNPGQLTVSGGITEAVTTAGDGADGGTLTVEGGNVGNIGENGSALTKVNFNNGSANNGITAGDIYATNIIIGKNTTTNVASIVSANSINGAVDFTSPGTLTVSGGITEAVTTTGNGDTGGTLIVNSGDIGNVGADGAALTEVIFNNGNTVSNTDNIYATTVTIGKKGANRAVVNTKTINGAINFAYDDSILIANGLITGNVNFIEDGGLQAVGIKGTVTAANGNGALGTTGSITGAIGTNGGSLKRVGIGVNDGNVVTLGGDVYAQTVDFVDESLGVTNNPIGTIQVAGNLIATIISFGSNASGGTLEFNGTAQQQLSGQIERGETLF